MKKLSPDTLKDLGQQQKKRLNDDSKVRVFVGMGTCGIASGAQEVYDTLLQEIERNDLSDVVVTKTGCIGLCYSEPNVEVIVPGMPPVVYGHVNADVARKIVDKHIIRKWLVNNHIFDKPSAESLS